MTSSLRHLGRAVQNVRAKRAGAWLLDDGSSLFDLSGGPLAQSLADVPAPDPRLFANVSASGGVETPVRCRFEEEVLRRAGEACGGVLWASSGSDAVELALWAVCATQHDGAAEPATYVVRSGGYHGSTALTRWLSMRVQPAGGPATGFGRRVVLRETLGSADRDRSGLVRQLEAGGIGPGSVVLLETVPTTGPCLWPGCDTYRELARWCDLNRVPLVLDEVASGVYRNGWFSALDWITEAPPAAVVLGKGLTSGAFPVACVLCRADIAAHLRQSGTRPPAFTYGLGDAVAALGLECLARYDRARAGGAPELRSTLLARTALRLRGREGLLVEHTDTTLRVGVTASDQAERVRSALRRGQIMVYENTARVCSECVTFFFAVPYLDLPPEAAAALLDRFATAVAEA